MTPEGVPALWCASERLRGHLQRLWNVTHGGTVENLAYIAATVDGLKDQLKQIMREQNTDTLTGTEHKATYKAVTSSRIDTTALKRELPGVAAQYTRATETRRFTFF